jgi:hypothetical protein
VSYYEGLPIYKSAMDMVVVLERVTRRFAKRHKYTLGARLNDTATDCVLWIARAQRRATRLQALDRLCARVEELKLLAQVGKETQAFFSFAEYMQVIEQVVSVAKQAEGWRAHARSQDASALRRPLRGVVSPPTAPRLATRLVQQGFRVAVALERPWSQGVLKHRELRYLLEPVLRGAAQGDRA